MASPETAGALLTAESLVIAALGVVLQKHELFMSEVSNILKQVLGATVAILFSLPFLGSLLYLHIAEYPDGRVGEAIPPKLVFNATIFTFVGFVYVGMGFVLILYWKRI